MNGLFQTKRISDTSITQWSVIKRTALLLVTLCAALILNGCGSMAGLMGPRTFNISQAQLLEALTKRFPFDNKMLDIFDVRLTNPTLSLDEKTNRVSSSVAVEVNNPLLSRALSGALSVSGGLRYDPQTNAVLLNNPKVESFKINGMPDRWANQVNKLGAVLLEQALQNAPLYTFKPDQLKLANTIFKPSDIRVQGGGLAVTLDPQTK